MAHIEIRKKFRFYRDRDYQWYGCLVKLIATDLVPVVGQAIYYQDGDSNSYIKVSDVTVDTVKSKYVVSNKNEIILNGDFISRNLPSQNGVSVDYDALDKIVEFDCKYSEAEATNFFNIYEKNGWRVEIFSKDCPESFKKYHTPFVSNLFKKMANRYNDD